MSKDKTPAEIAEIRYRRYRRRVYLAAGLWVAWLALFTAGVVTGTPALIFAAFAFSMGELAVVYYEPVLRMIAGRPAADYRKIRKLEKRELPAKKSEAQ